MWQFESDFELAGVALPRVKEVLDLGVNFNSKLNFSNHISIIITKAKQRLFLLKKIFRSRNPSLLILGFQNLCNSLARILFTSLEPAK